MKKVNTPANGVSCTCSSNFKQIFNSLGLCEVHWCQDRKITFKEPGVHSFNFFNRPTPTSPAFSAISEWGRVYICDCDAATFSQHTCERWYPTSCNDHSHLLKYGLQQLTQFLSLESRSHAIFKKQIYYLYLLIFIFETLFPHFSLLFLPQSSVIFPKLQKSTMHIRCERSAVSVRLTWSGKFPLSFLLLCFNPKWLLQETSNPSAAQWIKVLYCWILITYEWFQKGSELSLFIRGF